jgi:hypothetical protein
MVIWIVKSWSIHYLKKNDLKSFYNLRNTRKWIPYISSLITFDMDETNFLLWSTFNLRSTYDTRLPADCCFSELAL